MVVHPGDMRKLTSPEVASRLANGQTTAIVVLGAQEQHGRHLPLETDSRLGAHLAQLVSDRLGGALIAPVVSVGFSPEQMRFPGTLTLREETLAAVVEDYVTSLEAHGFTRIVLLPSHGGNFAPLARMLPQLRMGHSETEIVAYTGLSALGSSTAAIAAEVGVTADEAGAHGGEWETSLMLAVEPDRVQMDLAEAGFMGELGTVLDQIYAEGMESVAPNGILGDPAKASAGHGQMYFDRLAELITEHVRRESGRRSGE
jgi:creatinine amidohydrolase/Fe(II)-dependent formamide hydrolase-like protein